jgi:glycosyltransferase involved in cell wall biosynthesis
VQGHKGASVHVRELVAALCDLGSDVVVASPRVEFEGDAVDARAQLLQLPPVLPKKLSAIEVEGAVEAQAEALLELAERHEIDAVYERFSLFSVAGVRTARALGVPHVLEVNAPLREEAARFRILPHPELALECEREVLDSSERLFAVSRALAVTLASEGAEAAKIEIAPNGVALARFPAPSRDPDSFVVGFAGSLKPWHGVETMVSALAMLPEVHLEVLGHGPLEDELGRLPQARVARLGPRPHEEVVRRIARWDAGLAPYTPLESFWFSPLKVLEYMAGGTCTVASDVGDMRETLGDGERGVLVPPGDAGALAEAIARLAADRAHAGAIGARARAWVARHRSWEANASRVLAVFGAAGENANTNANTNENENENVGART